MTIKAAATHIEERAKAYYFLRSRPMAEQMESVHVPILLTVDAAVDAMLLELHESIAVSVVVDTTLKVLDVAA